MYGEESKNVKQFFIQEYLSNLELKKYEKNTENFNRKVLFRYNNCNNYRYKK